MTGKMKYDFECINFTEYQITLTTSADNKMLENIFTKSRQKLARVKGVNVSGDIENIDAFDIDKNFLPLIKTVMRKSLAEIAATVKKDGIDLLSMRVDKGSFKRKDQENWDITIIVKGDFADKR